MPPLPSFAQQPEPSAPGAAQPDEETTESQTSQARQDAQEAEVSQDSGVTADSAAQRQTIRENARRVLRESGVADLLQTLNRQALQGRGWFEEYDSGVLLKWGTSVTRRHIWVDVQGDQLRFRLKPHRRCASAVPACDGEYHSFTAQTWVIPGAVLREVDRNYQKPVAETSAD